MRALIHLGGVRAHTARPFAGDNAIHRMAPVLTKVAEWEGRAVILDDCEYTEQLQAVAISGGVASNVVPDGADLTVNYRFAPDRDSAAARVFLEGLLGEILEPDFGDSLTSSTRPTGRRLHSTTPCSLVWWLTPVLRLEPRWAGPT